MVKEMRACVKDFLKHVEKLEGEEDPDGCGFHREYRHIHELQIRNRRENVFKSTVGKEEINLKKNRYKDILPYDDHRVKLSKDGDEEGSDYINASHIKGVKGSGGYLASQGPLASSVNDFWLMIWEKKVEIVFMACRIEEMGKIKCKQYWNDVGAYDEFGDVTVLTESEESLSSDFIKREFRVMRGTEERTVIQYHYSGWPDHGIPSDPAHIRDLIKIVRQSRQQVDIPILVHCSAGCGRTGAIIAIDYVWTLLEEGKLDEEFSLYELICKFREQRMSIVQTPDQYALVYRVLKSLCEDWLVKMESHTYINVEVDELYANVGNNGHANQEEHIYEDSNSVSQNLINLDDVSSPPPPSSPAPPPPSSSSSQPPLPPKSNKSSTIRESNYVNVELSNNGKPKQASQQHQHSLSNSSHSNSNTTTQDEDEKVLHKTVIQIGSAAKKSSAPAPPAPSSSNLTATTTASSAAACGNSSGPTRQKEVVNLVHSSTPVGRPPAVTKSQTLPTPSLLSSSDQHRQPFRKSASVHRAGENRIVKVPNSPPGFDERLPRVRGPITMPEHWNQS